MQEYKSSCIQDTFDIAAKFAASLKPGSVVAMTGDLGAGKTAFVKGVAKYFNISEDIVSPTFNILLTYKSDKININHFDLYRLDTKEQLEDIGFYEIIESDDISFIEWSEKFPSEMPDNAIQLDIKKIDENSRIISF